MTRSIRIFPVLLLALAMAAGWLPAAKKKKKTGDEGMLLPPIVTDKKKKKDESLTQTLPPPAELPGAVAADSGRLAFQVTPLSSKGLLSQQTREALKSLLRSDRGASIVKLRAFVAGSGDLRRVGEIVGEIFREKHLPLPALTVVLAGALPMDGAQVVMEAASVEKRTVNPNGLAFLSGQAGASVGESLLKIQAALRASGIEPAEALAITCFLSSLEAQTDAGPLLASTFPGAATNFVQMQRAPALPACECEAIARVKSARQKGILYMYTHPPEYTQSVVLTAGEVVLSGAQLAFGSEEKDIKLAFQRLESAIGKHRASLGLLAMSHMYVTSRAMAQRVEAVRRHFYNAAYPPAGTLLPFEGLPSLDASFGVDVVAIPDAIIEVSETRH